MKRIKFLLISCFLLVCCVGCVKQNYTEPINTPAITQTPIVRATPEVTAELEPVATPEVTEVPEPVLTPNFTPTPPDEFTEDDWEDDWSDAGGNHTPWA